MSRVRWKGAFFTLPVLAVALATSAAAQATGTIEGKVTETGSGRPLSGAQIFIAGTTVGGVTNDRGEYRITGAPARQVALRVRLIGYSPITKSVVVTAGQTVTQDIEVGVSALQLEQVVVTGTGAQVEVKKLGNTIATIQPPAFAPITTPSQLLQARDVRLEVVEARPVQRELGEQRGHLRQVELRGLLGGLPAVAVLVVVAVREPVAREEHPVALVESP